MNEELDFVSAKETFVYVPRPKNDRVIHFGGCLLSSKMCVEVCKDSRQGLLRRGSHKSKVVN